jgi:AcrR family transcriptional regulator
MASGAMKLASASAKEHIILAAERLFAERGPDASMREISAAAGSRNHTAVQYHFGSKEQLIRAIFEYRHPRLDERRRMLVAQLHPQDLRSWLECYTLPILEQGEEEGSNFLSMIVMLKQYAPHTLSAAIPEEFQASTTQFREKAASLLAHDVPEPLRSHRLAQVVAFSVFTGADRERAAATGLDVLPFAVHVSDTLDGLVGFLEAPVSRRALAALETASVRKHASPLLL